MGFFNNFAANGCRKAMTAAYEKHRRSSRGETAQERHYDGLFGALASRIRTRCPSMPDMAVLESVVPFMAMTDDRIAVETLAEYALFQEAPTLANVSFLRNTVEETFAGTFRVNEAVITLLTIALNKNSPPVWLRFLQPATQARLRASLQQNLTDDNIPF